MGNKTEVLTMPDELKPCPFCKVKLEIDHGIFAVHPKNECILGLMPLSFHIRNPVWVDAWNRRVGEGEKDG